MFKSSSSDEFTLSDLSRSKTQPPYWRFRAKLGKTFLLKRFSCISHKKNRTDLNLAILRGRLLIHFLLFPGFWTKGLCNNYQEGGRGGGAEKLGLSSKNLDSTPLQNKKKLVLTRPLLF